MTSTKDDPASVAQREPLDGARRNVDVAYAVLMIAFTIAIVVQIYLAGAGAFAHHSGTTAVHHPFDTHETLGHILGIASVVLFVLALIARAGRSVVIGSFFLGLLTEEAQEGLAHAGHHNRWVGGLHAFDAGIILVLAVWLTLAAYKRRFGSSAR